MILKRSWNSRKVRQCGMWVHKNRKNNYRKGVYKNEKYEFYFDATEILSSAKLSQFKTFIYYVKGTKTVETYKPGLYA